VLGTETHLRKMSIWFIRDCKPVDMGGFVECAHPEDLTMALYERFKDKCKPGDVIFFYATGKKMAYVWGLNCFG